MKVLLMGDPNVGKSALFSRLTAVNVVCSNYPGTTVSYCKGKMRLKPHAKGHYRRKREGVHMKIHGSFDRLLKHEYAELIDVPGTYSLKAENPAEEVACEMLSEGDLVINVVDATNLERNLYLTLQLVESGKPVIVALNMSDDARHLGIEIDVEKMQQILGVPVVETVAVTGHGVKNLVERLPEARSHRKKRTEDERHRDAGSIAGKVQTLTERQHTIWDRMEDATIQPLTGLPIAALVLYLMFLSIITTGNWVIENALDPLFINYYGPFIRGAVGSVFPSGLAHDIILGEGEDFVESLGLLTTGLYVPLVMVLPFVVLFYFSLSLLEDVGYLPRLATLMDNMMHRIGLHGSAIVPSILGLGCNVPGVLSTRILETKKQRFISATLMAICIPCLAQNAVIVGLLLRYGLKYVAIVYSTLFVLYIVVGFILNKSIKGESPEILLEIPPYRMPDLQSLLKKTWVRVKYFISDAVPYVLFGVLLVNLLYVFGFVDFLSDAFGPVMSDIFGLPDEAVVALVVGFLRKDVAVGMLAPIGMDPMQLTIASTILAIYFPCVATFTVLYRELGLKDLMKSIALMVCVTVFVGASLNLLLL